MTLDGFHIHTAPDGEWRVYVLMNNGTLALTDRTKYASEATATLAAISFHRASPFMNYVAKRG